MADPKKPARDTMLFAYKDVQRAVCDARWKLIRYPQVDKFQLFDLQTDPEETTNLAGKSEFAPKVVELTALLEQEMKRSGDSGALTVAHPKPAAWSPPKS